MTTGATRAGGGPLAVGATAVVVALVAAILVVNGARESGLHLAVRATARCSALLFLAAFLAAPLRALRRTPTTAWLARNPRHATFAFAASHALHGFLVAAYLRAGGAPPEPAAAGAGAVGYAFIVALAATSFEADGPGRWRRLHVIGTYYLWAVFAAFFAGASAQGRLDAPLFAALLALALVARLWLLRRGRGVRDGVIG